MRRPRATREEWAQRIARWQDSGLTAEAFAVEIDVSPQSLKNWRWRLNKAQATAAAEESPGLAEEAAARFVELVPSRERRQSDYPLEMVLTRGVVLRVPQHFDEPTLLRVVQLLGGRS